MKIRLLWLIVMMLVAEWFQMAAGGQAEKRLNVLLIISDDLNVDVGCYGHWQVKTPHLDRLRQRGMVFDRAYAQYPLCNPSRNSFLTGQYPGHNGCLSNDVPLRKTAPQAVTLPELFKANGYRSVSTGKVFHHEVVDSWSAISNLRTGELLPLGRPPKFYRSPMADEMKTEGAGRLLADETVPWMEWRAVERGESMLVDGRTANAAIRRIDEATASGDPFFMAVGFSRPHDPYFAPKRFFDLYPLDSLILPTTPKDASPIPDYAFYSVFKRAFDKMDESQKREAMRAYYAGISYMDEQLGRVIQHVQAKGLMERTVIVFMGDHGYQVGEKNYWNKGVLFERSCRAPLIIITPHMKQAGGICRRIVQFVDIYPTVAELCGLTCPPGIDGVSLTGLLEEPTRPWKELAYSYCNADRSVRDARYRYIAWKPGGEALYDHMKDEAENYNLVADPACQDIVQRMRAWVAGMPEPK